MTRKVFAVVASAGRPQLLAFLTRRLLAQETAVQVVWSVPDEASCPSEREGVRAVVGARGLPAQRNAAITELLPEIAEDDLIFFFDDDFLPARDYVTRAIEFFAEHPEVGALTGLPWYDGVASRAPLDPLTGENLLDQLSEAEPSTHWEPWQELYGCNFGYRLGQFRDARFDPRLPLYGWLEDFDFAARLRRRTQLARVHSCRGVHLGSASGGRQAHLRLGYSQVANPTYLYLKGDSITAREWFVALKPLPKNIMLAVVGAQAAMRRQRLRGNLLAIGDLVRGRVTPERAALL